MAAYLYTLTNIKSSVRLILNEVSADFWTDNILTLYINEGIRIIAERTGCYRVIDNVGTLPAQRTVAFSGYKCLAVEYNNIALIKITPIQVGHAKLDGVAPQYWYEYGSYIGIEPKPVYSYDLTLYVLDYPPTLVDSSDIPVIPYSLCGLITYYAASRALQQDRKPGPAMQLMNMFVNELEFMSQALLPNIPDGTNDLRFT